ncbi:minor capsid protein [Levilactobacillus brevis]|nr:minor capsid protein [Levilactobacillus brevis]
MMKLSYWERRYLQTKAKEIRSTEAYEKAIQPELNGLFRELNGEVSKWIDKYAKNQGIDSDAAREALNGIHTKHWELTLKQFREKAKAGGYEEELDAEYFRSRVARLQSLEQQLRYISQPHAQNMADSMRREMVARYDDTYMRTNYNIQAQHGKFMADFARFNDAQLRIAVSQPWGKDGKDFSQRIWKNYQKELPSYLMDAVLRGTIMGYGPQKVTQMMHARFQDVKRNNVHRLVVSEMAHVAEEANARAYEENEIEEYEYMATLESHTCDVCAKLDGQVFKVSERRPGINYPTIHGRCRCTTVPSIKGLPKVGERWARDPETGKGKMVRDVKFDEWKQNYLGENRSIFPSAVERFFDQKDVQQMAAALADSPVALQSMWHKHQGQFALNEMTDKGASFFMPSTGQVTLNRHHVYASNDNWYRKQYDVVFHEFGHAIDSFSGKISIEKRFGFKESLNTDFSNWIDQQVVQKTADINEAGLKKVRKMVWDHSVSRGEYEGFKILFDTKTGELYDSSVREVVYEELRKSSESYENSANPEKAQSFGDVSDMIDAASLTADPKRELWITMGHGSDYYQREGTQVSEAFAEMTSATINNTGSLEKIKEIFPNAYEKYLIIVDAINRG